MTTRNWNNATDDEVMDADIALELGLDRLPQETTLAMLQEMGEKVNDVVLRRALGGLPQDQRDELDRLVATGNVEAVQAKLMEFVPEYPQMVWQETVRFKRSMLDVSPEDQATLQAAKAILDDTDAQS